MMEVVGAEGEDDVGAKCVVVNDVRQLPGELAALLRIIFEERNEKFLELIEDEHESERRSAGTDLVFWLSGLRMVQRR